MKLTLSPHAHFEAFSKSAVLALISMMLVDGTVPISSTGVCEVSSYGSFEKWFATCERKYFCLKFWWRYCEIKMDIDDFSLKWISDGEDNCFIFRYIV